MSGDVFGNAMLLSPHIRLVAAFNHQHIFIDPKPSLAASTAERKRLFRLKRSAWSDYARKHISRGGGVFDRAAKSIPVSDEMKKLFDLTRDSVTPATLIRAILTADVDLLWFGGIGTFVKAADERNTDVGDRANDSVRVDGGALRAKVIGEGANLGITQRGRIEYALKGGRINTDAIDNSGGVDTSDREVNIKILLNELVAGGAMTLRQRDTLLAKMTNDLAELVLRDNYKQTRAISLVAHQGTQILDQQVRLMRALEREGKLDPAIEDLPNDETLAERKAAGRGLTRPEISVLMSYAKIDLYDQLLASDLPDDRFLDAELLLDFPPLLGQKYEEAICRHRLRREIISTRITNDLINQVGGTFVRDEQERSGLGAADVARAYIITRDSFDLRSLWQAVDALDNAVPARVQAEIMLETRRSLERGTLWLLRNGRQPLDMAGYVERFRPCVSALSRALDDQLSTEDIAAVTARRSEFEREGVPTELATRVAGLDVLGAAFDIVRLTGGHAGDVIPVAKIYFSVGARFGMDWLRLVARRLTLDDHWDKLALAALLDDLYDHQYALTLKVLDTAGRATMAEGVVEAWIEARAHLARRVRQIVDDVRAAGAPDLAKLSVVNRQLADLAAS
ncbi:MAG: NAD-glutamate dehydrogenase domain-containing protein, partial [Alphaproteobacteria bacterium]